MRFYLCSITGNEGLLQVDGTPGQLPSAAIHPRTLAVKTLIDQLREKPYNSGTLPSDLSNSLALGWWLQTDLARFSKWCHYDGPGEDVARRIARRMFRHGGEEDFLLPRLLDQKNQPKNPYFGVSMPSEQVFGLWAAHVVQSWGGRVEHALGFPSLHDARQHFNNNP